MDLSAHGGSTPDGTVDASDVIATSSYDEDLSVNSFYVALHERHRRLLTARLTADRQNTILVVPREGIAAGYVAALPQLKYMSPGALAAEEDLFATYIIRPFSGGTTGEYITANNKLLRMEGDHLRTLASFRRQVRIRILFEESMVNRNGQSLKTMCIQSFLPGTELKDAHGDEKGRGAVQLRSVVDSIEYLFQSVPATAEESLRAQLDEVISTFQRGLNDPAKPALDDVVQQLRDDYDRVKKVYLRLAAAAASKSSGGSSNSSSGRRTQTQAIERARQDEGRIKVALETYIVARIHASASDRIGADTCEQDRILNQKAKLFLDMPSTLLSALKLAAQSAANSLGELNFNTSPLEKLICINRTIQQFYAKLASLAKGKAQDALSSDELIPALMVIVASADVPNWHANLHYLELLMVADSYKQQVMFYLASLRGAVQQLMYHDQQQKDEQQHQQQQQQRQQEHEELVRTLEDVSASDESAEVDTVKSYDDSIPPPTPSRQRNEAFAQNSDFPYGDQPLFNAIANGDVDMVEALLTATSTVNSLSPTRPAHHPLCECEQCKRSTEETNNVESTIYAVHGIERFTPLHVAVIHDSYGSIEVLLNHGAVVDSRDVRKRTPLHLVCRSGNERIMQLLLDRGADITSVDDKGNTLLHFCSLYNQKSLVGPVCRAYASSPAVAARASSAPQHIQSVAKHVSLSAFLAVHDTDGFDVGNIQSALSFMNTPNDHGDTPMHLAAHWGFAEMCNELVTWGALWNLQNNMHLTPSQISLDPATIAMLNALGELETSPSSSASTPQQQQQQQQQHPSASPLSFAQRDLPDGGPTSIAASSSSNADLFTTVPVDLATLGRRSSLFVDTDLSLPAYDMPQTRQRQLAFVRNPLNRLSMLSLADIDPEDGDDFGGGAGAGAGGLGSANVVQTPSTSSYAATRPALTPHAPPTAHQTAMGQLLRRDSDYYDTDPSTVMATPSSSVTSPVGIAPAPQLPTIATSLAAAVKHHPLCSCDICIPSSSPPLLEDEVAVRLD